MEYQNNIDDHRVVLESIATVSTTTSINVINVDVRLFPWKGWVVCLSLQCWHRKDRHPDDCWHGFGAGCPGECGGYPFHCYQDDEAAYEDGPEPCKGSWHVLLTWTTILTFMSNCYHQSMLHVSLQYKFTYTWKLYLFCNVPLSWLTAYDRCHITSCGFQNQLAVW